MTPKLIIANWKTYLTASEALALGRQIPAGDDIIIAPSMLHLGLVKEHLPDGSR
jgi:triosephosphate isomerase